MNMLAPIPGPAESDLLPREAPLGISTRDLDWMPETTAPSVVPSAPRRRLTVLALTLAVVALLAWAMIGGLLREGLAVGEAAFLALYLPNISWIAFAAATALCGAFWWRREQVPTPPEDWLPFGRTAVLVPARNEDVAALGGRIAALRADLATRALRSRVDIFVLSDSDDPYMIRAEEALAARLAISSPVLPPVYYRRRTSNAGRKPGNIAEWIRRWGGSYAYMLVLDADSRMSSRRIAGMIGRMEDDPRIGLVQAGLRLTGAESRFARLQQRANRLYGQAFTSGIAGWAGAEGNYWGHNALIRVRAFAEAAGLPTLTGRPPFGGDVLSHDFVEAAWLRRAGWAVVVDPDDRGSAEGGPETMEAFHKRDRRWCQGNMQHLRVLFGARGLHWASRLHLLCGIGSYVAAPLWLGLVVVAIVSGASGHMILPLVGAMALILVQKLAGVAVWMRQRPGSGGKIVRMAARELALSSLIAPIMMIRQTLAVASVFAGQDCGWKPAGGRRSSDAMPWLEPAAGALLLLAALPGVVDNWQVAFVLPIALPLLLAPMIVQWMDAVPDVSRWPDTREPEPVPVVVPHASAR